MMLRPILWFTVASMAVTILHELAHALTAFVLGVRSTLFSYFADIDLTAAQAATNIPALIAIAGPSFCLAVGIFSWGMFRRARNPRARLPLLFLTVFGIATFGGNLMSAPFVGDFSGAADTLGLPMSVRYGIAAAGLISVAAVHFWAGRELIQGVPEHAGKARGTFGFIAYPVVLGTAAVILVNQPMPVAFATARIAEASFWLFAVVGALVTRKRSPGSLGTFDLRWADGTAALFAIVVVRLMVRGIPLSP